MRQVSLSGLADIWNYPSSDKNTADLLVLGGVPDDHGQAWRVSALLLQRQLGLACYETAWMMLHKLRRAMVNNAREPLRGEVEVDETWIGGEQAGLRGSRQLKHRRAALVLVDCRKVTITSCYASKLVWRQAAKSPSPRTN